MKLVISLFSAFYFLLFFPSPVRAVENFATSYDVTYTVRDDGVTNALFAVSLTNKTSSYYASSYKMRLGFTNIFNVKASDPDGEISPSVTKTQDGKIVTLAFNKRVVGEGNTLGFTLSFDTRDIAQKQGNIWEVNIPGITNKDDFTNFIVHVKVPFFLKNPTYIKPYQETTSLDFTKDQLGRSGISLAFGDRQLYAFSLTYHLKNTNVFPIRTEIALPPSTNYQDILIENIEPVPTNVLEDDDGNWLAEFTLSPSEKKDIVVKGKAQVFLFPREEIVSESKLTAYTKAEPYWERNEEIKKLAETLKTPENIYRYVVENLTYDFERVTNNSLRLGAKKTLANPNSAVCLEFTDLFVAIARAAGIPAREVDGFAYTQNAKQRPLSLVQDILHAWPEYYDREKKTWIMVDPTWGNTTGGVDYFNTLDFDHVAFVIKGQNSDYPIPAGGYKLAGFENTKDVGVSFTESFEAVASKTDVTTNLPKSIFSALPVKGSIIIKNAVSSVYAADSVVINSSDFLPNTQKISFGNIPPYGYVKIPISFAKTPFLTKKKATVRIKLSQDTIVKQIQVSPFFLSKMGILGGVLIGSSMVALSIFAARTWRIPLFGRKG